MAARFPGAVRRGTQAASRLHVQLNDRSETEERGANVDVFRAMARLGLAVLIRPLDKLLGAFLTEPAPGALVTTKRRLSVQRFTAAHELGHFCLGHVPSLDDRKTVERNPFDKGHAAQVQEVEANAFAVNFLMPRWLVASHCKRHGWKSASFDDPTVVYQLSLRLGVSYTALCWALRREKLASHRQTQKLIATRVKDIKSNLLGDFHPPMGYWGDVWLLTELDQGTHISGSRDDLFLIQLHEHSGSGYLWNIDQLAESGFSIHVDFNETSNRGQIGAHTARKIIASIEESGTGTISLEESRPWQRSTALNHLCLDYDLTGPEQQGLTRTDRFRILATD